jgi:hypothetical protein
MVSGVPLITRDIRSGRDSALTPWFSPIPLRAVDGICASIFGVPEQSQVRMSLQVKPTACEQFVLRALRYEI